MAESSKHERAATGAGVGRTLAATCFGIVAVQFDATLVNVALPHIADQFGAGVGALQWVVDAYILTFAALLLSAGVLADRVGTRRVFLIGLAGFAAASAACGLTRSVAGLIVLHGAEGLFAAALVPSALALLNHACAHDDALRAKAVAVWTAAGGLAVATGPVLGGALVQWLGWRSIFLINVLVCAVGIVFARGIPETPRNPGHRFDPIGQSLAMVALAAAVFAAIESGMVGWRDARVLGGLALAAAAVAAFVRLERRSAQPLLPLSMFRRRGFGAAVVFGMLVNVGLFGAMFVLTLYLQRVRGYSPLQTGLAFLPLTAPYVVANVLGGWLIGRCGAFRSMVAGALIGALGFVLLLTLDATSGFAQMLGPFLLIPSGLGVAIPATTTAILASVERARSGLAAAVLNAARQTGGCLGVAICGALVAGGTARIVPGLHAVAGLATLLLVAAAALVVWRQRKDVLANAAGD